jgi:hypothetical protein
LLELASLQPWCHGNKQRVRLLCCCRPLSTLAVRLAHEVDREGGCRLQWSAVARIMARCLAAAHTLLHSCMRSELFLQRPETPAMYQ